MPGRLPANAAPFWDALVTQFAPDLLHPFLTGPGNRPGDPALGTVFRRFDPNALVRPCRITRWKRAESPVDFLLFHPL